MTMYTATFPNGDKLNRTSKGRQYGAAWRVLREGVVKSQGFARDEAAAKKTSATEKRAWQCDAVEVVKTAIVPEGFENQFKIDNPWRITFEGAGGRVLFLKEKIGNAHRRFASQAEADAVAASLNAQHPSRFYEATNKAKS